MPYVTVEAYRRMVAQVDALSKLLAPTAAHVQSRVQPRVEKSRALVPWAQAAPAFKGLWPTIYVLNTTDINRATTRIEINEWIVQSKWKRHGVPAAAYDYMISMLPRAKARLAKPMVWTPALERQMVKTMVRLSQAAGARKPYIHCAIVLERQSGQPVTGCMIKDRLENRFARKWSIAELRRFGFSEAEVAYIKDVGQTRATATAASRQQSAVL